MACCLRCDNITVAVVLRDAEVLRGITVVCPNLNIGAVCRAAVGYVKRNAARHIRCGVQTVAAV